MTHRHVGMTQEKTHAPGVQICDLDGGGRVARHSDRRLTIRSVASHRHRVRCGIPTNWRQRFRSGGAEVAHVTVPFPIRYVPVRSGTASGFSVAGYCFDAQMRGTEHVMTTFERSPEAQLKTDLNSARQSSLRQPVGDVWSRPRFVVRLKPMSEPMRRVFWPGCEHDTAVESVGWEWHRSSVGVPQRFPDASPRGLASHQWPR